MQKRMFGVSKWTEQEKDDFALAVYLAKQEHPEWSWRKCFDEGNKLFPVEKHIGAKVSGPTQMPWLNDRVKVLSANPSTSPQIPPSPSQEINNPPKQQHKKKVFLNGKEQMIFAEALHAVREKHPRWHWKEQLAAANEALPEDRQISMKTCSPSQLNWLPDLLEEIANRPAVAEPEIPATPIAPAVVEPSPVVLDLQSLIVKAIVDALKPVLLHIVQSNQLQDAIKEVIAPAPVVETKHEDKRPKVLIVGLLPHLGQELQVAYGRHFNLKFMKSETSHSQLRDQLKQIDFPIIMTKFVSHSTQAILRQHPGMVFCNGNVSALKQILHNKLEHH